MPTTYLSSSAVTHAAATVKRSTSNSRRTRRSAAAPPPAGGPPRPPRGMLHALSPVVVARLRDEGVPDSEIRTVARQLHRLLPILAHEGTDEITLPVSPWVLELIDRYADKTCSLFIPTRDKRRKVKRV